MEEQDTARMAVLWHGPFLRDRERLVQLAVGIVGCRADAEDIVQDAFFKAKNARNATGIICQRSYLSRVVRNLSIDRLRRSRLEKRLMEYGIELGDVPNRYNNAPEQMVSDMRLLERLATELAAMPERMRFVFEMNRIHGQTQSSLAKKLNISTATVNSMICDVQCSLREIAHEDYC